jgi:Uma2 family endonuclease
MMGAMGMVAKSTSVALPTHLDLPETDGLPMENDFQPDQAQLLTAAIRPLLDQVHPKGDYFVGQDVGIYWKVTDPPLNGCKVPDWCYVSGATPLAKGEYRRSFVMWQEGVAPLLVMEFVSGDGLDEHDDTPATGKFWVYKRGIRAGYYAIHDPRRPTLEVFKSDGVEFRRLEPNAAGVVPIPEMGIALGHWNGQFGGHHLTWIRFFTTDGQLIETPEEQLAALKSKLRAKGIDPDTL